MSQYWRHNTYSSSQPVFVSSRNAFLFKWGGGGGALRDNTETAVQESEDTTKHWGNRAMD